MHLTRLLLCASGAATTLARILPRQANTTGSYAVKTPPLDTPWTYKVGTNPWPEYPRPQLERSEWKNLNGIWRYQNASGMDAVDNPPFNQTLAQEVLIPSCLESGLSGKQAGMLEGDDKLLILVCVRHSRRIYALLVVLHLVQRTVVLDW